MKRLFLYLITALVTFSAGYLLWQAGKSHNSEVKLERQIDRQVVELRAMQDAEVTGKLEQEIQKLGCAAPGIAQTKITRQQLCETLKHQHQLLIQASKEYLEDHSRY